MVFILFRENNPYRASIANYYENLNVPNIQGCISGTVYELDVCVCIRRNDDV